MENISLENYKFFGKKIGTRISENIPKELRNFSQWLLWKEIDGRKVPCSIVEGKLRVGIAANKQEYWLKFQDALYYAQFNLGLMFYIGNLEYWCLDFDDFSNIEEVKEIVEKAESYSEITPSGVGFRIWFKGSNPFGKKERSFSLSDGRKIEMFNERQIVVTGFQISQESRINEITPEFYKFLKEKYLKEYLAIEKVTNKVTNDENVTLNLNKDVERIIKELINRYGGINRGSYISLHCPLHPPDEHPSAEIYLNDGSFDNIKFICHHEKPDLVLSLKELLERIGLINLLFEEKEEPKEIKIVNDWKEVPYYEKKTLYIKKELLAVVEEELYIYEASFSQSDTIFFIKSNEPLRKGEQDIVIVPNFFLGKLITTLRKDRLVFLLKQIDGLLSENILFSSKTKLDLENNNISVLNNKLMEYKELENKIGANLFYERKNEADIHIYFPDSEKNIEELLRVGLYQGAKYDDAIELIYRAYLFRIPHKFSHLARYAPHGIIVTNTKSGKSFLGQTIGKIIDKSNFSRAGLIGHSDGKKINYGLLHYTEGSVFFDEVGDKVEDKEDLIDGLNNLMESGLTEIAKGLGLICRFGNSLTFLSNKKLVKDGEPLGNAFMRILILISSNIEALGSRMGIVFFNPHCTTVNTQYIQVENKRKIQAKSIINSLTTKISKVFIDLCVNSEKISKWLEKPFPESYVEMLKKLVEKHKIDSYEFELIKSFIESHLVSYRHVRGAALRMALWEPRTIYQIIHNQLDEEELIGFANDYFEYICKINFRSIELLMNEKFVEFEKINIEYWNSFNAGLSDAIKILLFSLKCYYDKFKETKIDTINKDSSFIKFYNEKIRHLFEDNSYGHGFSKVEKRIVEVNNEKLINMLGVSIIIVEEGLLIEIVDKNKFTNDFLSKLTLKSGKRLDEIYNLYKSLFEEEREGDKLKIKNNTDPKSVLLSIFSNYSSDQQISYDVIREQFLKTGFDELELDNLLRMFQEKNYIFEPKRGIYMVLELPQEVRE